MKVALTLSLAIAFGAIGDILLSAGMQANGEVEIRRLSHLPRLIASVFSRPFIVAGVVVMTLYFFSYAAALAWVDVSVANPMTALSYVLATGYAAVAMHERVGPQRWIGVAMVTLGAILVGLSS